MKTSKFFISTLKEVPAEAEIASHRLMLRAGLIRRLAAGVYTWLPLGLKVFQKVEGIVREEMNRAGALELVLPVVQPAEPWQGSTRRQGPAPRIFPRLGLQFRAVAADTGAIGGTGSHEFHVLAESGEDAIAFSRDSDYAANVELAEAVAPGTRSSSKEEMRKVPTPGKTRCEDVAALLKIDLKKTVKAVAVMHDDELYLLLLRGDHELNEIKAQKVIGEFRFANEKEIENSLRSKAGYIGPVNTKVKVVADRRVALMSDFVCGANEEGYHLTGVNFGRDVAEPQVADIRNVVAGDPSPDGNGRLEIVRGLAVGHILQLRTKYSQAMNAVFLDEKGEARPMEMGCYGIGVTRVVAAAIEQNHDERGIVFPAPIAPFAVA